MLLNKTIVFHGLMILAAVALVATPYSVPGQLTCTCIPPSSTPTSCTVGVACTGYDTQTGCTSNCPGLYNVQSYVHTCATKRFTSDICSDVATVCADKYNCVWNNGCSQGAQCMVNGQPAQLIVNAKANATCVEVESCN